MLWNNCHRRFKYRLLPGPVNKEVILKYLIYKVSRNQALFQCQKENILKTKMNGLRLFEFGGNDQKIKQLMIFRAQKPCSLAAYKLSTFRAI